MKNLFFKSLTVLFLIVTLCSLTACGGGGGGSNDPIPPTTANVKIAVPAELFNQPAPSTRAVKLAEKLIISAVAYNDKEGKEVSGVQHINVEAQYRNDDSYIAEVSGLNTSFAYRFSAIYNNKEILKNHVGVASITSGASFDVNIYTSYKTLAYDAWIANNPTDKSFNNFISKSAESGISEEKKNFGDAVNFSYNDFKDSLAKITSGQDASLPTVEAVDAEKLPATGNNTDNPDNPVNPTTQYATLSGKLLQPEGITNAVYEVALYDSTGFKEKKSVSANSSFTFENLTPTTYTLAISSDETLNIIREITLANNENKTITDGRNDGIMPSKVEGTFTPVTDAVFTRIDLYAFVQYGTGVYYEVWGNSSQLNEYDEVGEKALSNNIFDAYTKNSISVYTPNSMSDGQVKFFFKNSSDTIVFEKWYTIGPKTSIQQTSNGYSVTIFDNITLDLVNCPAGSFVMGSPENEVGRIQGANEPQHNVTISKAFYIGKFEVTQGQYKALMGGVLPPNGYYLGDNYPVYTAHWSNAKDFCDTLNKILANKLPTGYKFDLPTEAQWEYACRAGTTTALNDGKVDGTEEDLKDRLNLLGWFFENSGSDDGGHVLKECGLKTANQFGLYDMHGNVSEWCRDYYSELNSESVTDPICTTISRYYVARGGHYMDNAGECRSAYRFKGSEEDTAGFRVALVPIQ